MSISKKDLGLLIIFAGIVLSVFEEEEVVPVDNKCAAMNGDYKKELVMYLFFAYGIYAELRYIMYFVTFAIYAIQKPSKKMGEQIPVLIFDQKQALLMV